MDIYSIIIGIMLLLFGRKLFWLFIGLAGFLLGLEGARLYLIEQPPWLQLAVAIATGCLGALVAIIAQRLAFTVAGFFAGLFLGFKLGQLLGLSQQGHLLLPLVAGLGVVGAFVAILVTDRAVTLLTCLVGAGAIVGELPLAREPAFVAFVILAVAGYLIQNKLFGRAKEEAPPPL